MMHDPSEGARALMHAAKRVGGAAAKQLRLRTPAQIVLYIERRIESLDDNDMLNPAFKEAMRANYLKVSVNAMREDRAAKEAATHAGMRGGESGHRAAE